MRNYSIIILATALIITASCKEESSPVETSTQGSISGYVTNKENESGLSKVNIFTNPATSSVTTASDGYYKIENVDAGTFEVTALKDGFDTLRTDVTVVAGKETIADFITQPIIIDKSKDYAFIKGRVLDKYKLIPIEGVNIKTTPSTSSVTSYPDGSYLIRNLSSGKYEIHATKIGYDSTSIEVSISVGDTTIADIFISESDTSIIPITGNLSGKIIDAVSGERIKDAIIVTVPSTGVVNSDDAGSYSFSGLTPGKYTIKVSKLGYQDNESEVLIEAGNETTADISLMVSYGSIQGVVTDDETGEKLQGVLITTTPGTSSVLTDSAGNYSQVNISPGTYSVAANKNGYETSNLSISVLAGGITRADFVLTREQ